MDTPTTEELLARYVPPSWLNGYDNRHLLEVLPDGTFKPTPEYQACADTTNAELEKYGYPERLVWDTVTTSFVMRPVDNPDGVFPKPQR
jgi:hypothetical protein